MISKLILKSIHFDDEIIDLGFLKVVSENGDNVSTSPHSVNGLDAETRIGEVIEGLSRLVGNVSAQDTDILETVTSRIWTDQAKARQAAKREEARIAYEASQAALAEQRQRDEEAAAKAVEARTATADANLAALADKLAPMIAQRLGK